MSVIKGNLADGKKIKLTRGKFAIVDSEDFEWLNQWKWHAGKGGKYAARKIYPSERVIYMHRLLMNTPENMETDHVNGNGLDNRKKNLRVCTGAENRMNHKLLSTNKSGFNGVSWNKDIRKWSVCISVKAKTIHGGEFKDIIEAAKKYNELAKKYFGKYARYNKIGGNK